MAASILKLSLNNGLKIPAIGLGTWLAKPGEVYKAVTTAINLGYRLFDCAFLYDNEKEIGEALRAKIADGTVKREELFVTSKLWNTYHEIDKVVPTCRQTVQNFGLDYIDLYLVHWPVAQKDLGKIDVDFPFANAIGLDYDYLKTWTGMEKCLELGLTKSIGLSNFNSRQMLRVLQFGEVKPVANQVEVNPNLNQKKLIKLCHENDVQVMSYSPFGSPARPWAEAGDPFVDFKNKNLLKIAEKYNKTAYQIVLRYLVDIGTIPIPKSTNERRLKENIDIFDFKLTEKEIGVIDGFNRDFRSVPAAELKGMPNYPFTGVEF